MPTKNKRYRSFAFVQKLENLPETWEDDFKNMLWESAYIIHDKDEGTEPHVHFYLYSQGKRSLLTVLNEIPESFKVLHIEAVRSKMAYLRYMLHWGYNEKFQYEWNELKLIGGLKVNLADLANVDLISVIDTLEDYNPVSFYDFTIYCKNNKPELLRYIQSHFQLIDRLITARNY